MIMYYNIIESYVLGDYIDRQGKKRGKKRRKLKINQGTRKRKIEKKVVKAVICQKNESESKTCVNNL